MKIDNSSIDAIFRYANMLYEGDGIPVDKKEAAKYFRMTINKDNIDAADKCGDMLYGDDGIPSDK